MIGTHLSDTKKSLHNHELSQLHLLSAKAWNMDILNNPDGKYYIDATSYFYQATSVFLAYESKLIFCLYCALIVFNKVKSHPCILNHLINTTN